MRNAPRSPRRSALSQVCCGTALSEGSALASGGAPISAGWKISAETSVQTSEIISSLPMLAVPGWLESHRLPKPVAVVSAEKNTALARLEVRRCEPPERHDITK